MTAQAAANEHARPEGLDQEFALSAPPAKVWRALTEPALVTRWLLPAASVAVRCEPLDAEPGRRVSYRWRDGALDSVVTFSIAPDGAGGTRLRVLHTAAPAVAMRGVSCALALNAGRRPVRLLAANANRLVVRRAA